MKRPILVTSLCLSLLGIGWAGVRHKANSELKRGISNFYAHLPPGVTFSYTKAYPRILSRGAGFTNVRITRGNAVFTADQLLVNAPSGAPRTGLHFTSVTANTPQLDFATDHGRLTTHARLKARSFHLYDVRLPTLDADNHARNNFEALIATQVGRLRAEHFTAQTRDALLDERAHRSYHANQARAAIQSVGHLDVEIDALGLTDIGQDRAELYEMQNFRLSRTAISGRDTSGPSEPKLAIQIDRIRHLPLSAPIFNYLIFNRPFSPKAALLCVHPRRTVSIGPLSGQIERWRFHLDALNIPGTKDGESYKTGISETPGYIEIPDSQIDKPSRRENFSTTAAATCTKNNEKLALSLEINASEFADYAFNAKLGPIGISGKQNAKDSDPLLQSMRMAYRDHGLLSLVIARLGAPEGVSEEALRAELAAAASQLSSNYPDAMTLSKYIASPDGRALELTFAPKQPIGLNSLIRGQIPGSSGQFPSSWHLRLKP